MRLRSCKSNPATPETTRIRMTVHKPEPLRIRSAWNQQNVVLQQSPLQAIIDALIEPLGGATDQLTTDKNLRERVSPCVLA